MVTTRSSQISLPYRTVFPEPIRVPEGYLLRDSNSGYNQHLFVFSVMWLALWSSVSFAKFRDLLFTFFDVPSLDALMPLLLISIFVGLGIWGVFLSGRSLYRIYRIKEGELILPTYPLYLGETYRIKFRRQLRRGRIVVPGKITADWINYEWIQYRRGSETVAVTHELKKIQLSAQKAIAGTKQIEYDAQITVPENTSASIHTPNNQVRWELQINVDLPFIVKDISHFVVKVLPT